MHSDRNVTQYYRGIVWSVGLGDWKAFLNGVLENRIGAKSVLIHGTKIFGHCWWGYSYKYSKHRCVKIKIEH